MKNSIIVISIFILTAVAVLLAGTSDKVEFVQGDNQVDILIGGKLFTTWLYKPDLVKPILYPVKTPSGTDVNRAFPLQEIEGESQDHPHHTGLFFTFMGVNGLDKDNFWGARTPPPQIKQVQVLEKTGGKGKGTLVAVLDWNGDTGKTLLTENRTMVFYAGQHEYAIDFTMQLTARDTTIFFEDTKEGMFAIRVAQWLKEKGGTGKYLNSHGEETAANVWGKRAEWVRLEGEKEGQRIGIAIFNHPSSTNYPTYWHARDYGLFSANPLGQLDFQKFYKIENPQPFNLTLQKGESALFKFRVLIYEGQRSKKELDLVFEKYKTE